MDKVFTDKVVKDAVHNLAVRCEQLETEVAELQAWKAQAERNIETVVNLWPHVEDVLMKGLEEIKE